YTGIWKSAMMRYGKEAKSKSALRVVTPDASARSEYRSPKPISIKESDRTMWVDERCTMVTSAPASHNAAQISCAELLAPITTTFLPAYASGPGCCEECCCSPLNTSCPFMLGTLALPDMPVAKTNCCGRSVMGLPSRSISTSQVWLDSS